MARGFDELYYNIYSFNFIYSLYFKIIQVQTLYSHTIKKWWPLRLLPNFYIFSFFGVSGRDLVLVAVKTGWPSYVSSFQCCRWVWCKFRSVRNVLRGLFPFVSNTTRNRDYVP